MVVPLVIAAVISVVLGMFPDFFVGIIRSMF